MTARVTSGLPEALRRPGTTALLALAVTRRAPMVPLALAVLARARLARTTDAGAGSGGGGTERSGDDRAVRLALGIAAARLLVPAVSAPLALVGSLLLVTGVTGVVLVLAGGITLVAGVAGLSGLG